MGVWAKAPISDGHAGYQAEGQAGRFKALLPHKAARMRGIEDNPPYLSACQVATHLL